MITQMGFRVKARRAKKGERRHATLSARASELSRVAVESARDMNTTGHAAPHRTPPKRHSAAYMIAFTVRFADSRLGNSNTSVTPESES